MPEQYVPRTAGGCILDYTYCANPDCKNECGRQMSDEIKHAISKMGHVRVATAHFCGICR